MLLRRYFAMCPTCAIANNASVKRLRNKPDGVPPPPPPPSSQAVSDPHSLMNATYVTCNENRFYRNFHRGYRFYNQSVIVKSVQLYRLSSRIWWNIVSILMMAREPSEIGLWWRREIVSEETPRVNSARTSAMLGISFKGKRFCVIPRKCNIFLFFFF